MCFIFFYIRELYANVFKIFKFELNPLDNKKDIGLYVLIYILVHGKSLCVAAFVSNGTLLLVSKLCSDDLQALCYNNQNDGDKTSKFSHQA
jgi:hypothetical protein